MRGAWVEMRYALPSGYKQGGRSPCGERGLKCIPSFTPSSTLRRSPCGERGLKWILGIETETIRLSLPVRGAWVEISARAQQGRCAFCRSPCGERGLKYHRQRPKGGLGGSLPVRGAWVEISKTRKTQSAKPSRSPCGERGLKSRPPIALCRPCVVAPRAGSVG